MSSTEFASNESGMDIEKKMDTKETIGLDDEQFFDNETEAIKVTTDHAGEPTRWGKGIIRDFKRTVGTHWFKEMTNFNQKTVAVTVSDSTVQFTDWISPHSLTHSTLLLFSSSSTLQRLPRPLPSEPCMEGVPRTTWEPLS